MNDIIDDVTKTVCNYWILRKTKEDTVRYQATQMFVIKTIYVQNNFQMDGSFLK